MSTAYRVVQWNRHKKLYDAIAVMWIALFLAVFVLLGMLAFPAPEEISPPVLLIRALGTCAIILLHIILMIGPLARLLPRMNIVLYNRRHLGVMFFIVALAHALFVFIFYGGFGVQNPVLAVLTGGTAAGGVPFELFGFFALLIFALMAATSHDYWLAALGPSFWKFMHMGVYIAYALVLAHVVFGVLRNEPNIIYPLLLTCGAGMLVILHLLAGLGEVSSDHRSSVLGITTSGNQRWYDVCSVDEIREDRAKIVQLNTQERIAVFRHSNTVSAVTNVCAHQGGPLGEGKIIDGCITCPWHGHQFRPDSGEAPAPYKDRIATYDIRVQGRRVLIAPKPNTPGTRVAPACFEPWPEHQEHG